MPAPAYAELAVTSNFSFLRGGSHPEELVETAAQLGHHAVAVADRNTLAGVVRAHIAAKREGIRLVVGARLVLDDGFETLAFPCDRAAYGRLSHLLTLGKLRTKKGECAIGFDDLLDHGAGHIFVALPPAEPNDAFAERLARLNALEGSDAYLAAAALYRGDDTRRLARLATFAETHGLEAVAINDVHYHVPERRALQDVVTCIREHCTIGEAGVLLDANAERHLKTPKDMARLFRRYPEALARTVEIAERCTFSLDELRYEYPVDPVPDGRTPQQELERLTWIGAQRCYPGGVPDKVRTALAHELALIGQLAYAPYLLTVHDIVRFAREEDILCQGRGSAANSAVCYVLGITAVDPGRVELLFERFVSAERNEPPDIDVDFEHERREEVIQYIYDKYGRDRAGIAATVITYRARSAIREVGKAMGLSEDAVGALAGTVWGWSSDGIEERAIREAGLDPADPTMMTAAELARELIGFPRHLSQHVGGFVITKGVLSEVVPIENGAMPDRTFIEWDKDDLDALGMLKIDVLGLGMLTCIRKGFDLIEKHYGRRLSLESVPAEDPAVYDMLCKADSIGVFQVESRAQMSMLPRLKPRSFYDLVIEVAIVRPGPIQGDMVHPYLRRRNGEERVDFPSKELRQVLGKTLGVPLFQEQAMRIAIVAAGFTPSEADGLRRAMATFRKTGQIHGFHDKMIDGMTARGYERDFAERCFRQIEGFGDYGFPESHSASFSLLVYVSAWLKCHCPAAFAAALLNSQPMGFYAPAQIVRDAREHEVRVLPVDVNASEWDCTLEPVPFDESPLTLPLPQGAREEKGECALTPSPLGGEGRGEGEFGDTSFALRLGFRQIKGMREDYAEMLVAARSNGYPDPLTLWRRAQLPPAVLERLARADAFTSQGLDRREALWAVKILGPEPLPLFAAAQEEEQANDPPVRLPKISLGEQVVDDYAALRLSLKAHPVSFFRDQLTRQGVVPNERLPEIAPGRRITVCGLVLVRQRPGSAKGVIFATLEDETGIANVIVWPPVFERSRRIVLGARLMKVTGRLQREGLVIHIVAETLEDMTPFLLTLSESDHAMDASTEAAMARADEVKRPGVDPKVLEMT
ncbi:MAG: error-prone DNA polymerase, partial [Alphaproteobacteria bacterium]